MCTKCASVCISTSKFQRKRPLSVARGAKMDPDPQGEESGLVTGCGCTAPLSLSRLSRQAVSKSRGLLRSFQGGKTEKNSQTFDLCPQLSSEVHALTACIGVSFPASDRAACSSIFAEITCKATSVARF